MEIFVYGTNPKMDTGMGKCGKEMAKCIAQEHEVHFFSPTEGVVGPEDYENFKLYGNPGDNQAGRDLTRLLLDEIKPDIFFTNRNWQSVTWMHNVLNSLYMNDGTEIDMIYYGPPVETEQTPPNFKNLLVNEHLNKVRLIPFTENRYHAMKEEWGLEDHIDTWIPHGINHDIFRPRDEEEVNSFRKELGTDGRFTIIQVCENWRRKNIDLTLEAFDRFSSLDNVEDPVLILHTQPHPARGNDQFYSGWDIHTLVRNHGFVLGDDVHLTKKHAADFVDREVMSMMYNSADMMVLPTGGEGFSLTTLESMACGTPVLQTNVDTLKWLSGGAAEYIDVVQTKRLRQGDIMATPSVDSMVGKMKKLHDSPDLRGEMSARGLERSDDFSWDRTAEESLEYMNQLEKERGVYA